MFNAQSGAIVPLPSGVFPCGKLWNFQRLLTFGPSGRSRRVEQPKACSAGCFGSPALQIR
jgi:hypothetical protein